MSTNITFDDIPTIHFTEVVRVYVGEDAYDARIIFTWADGSRTLAYTTTDGTVHIVRVRA